MLRRNRIWQFDFSEFETAVIVDQAAYNTIRPHEHLAFVRPLDAYLTAPTAPLQTCQDVEIH